jgi:hypothetical protein
MKNELNLTPSLLSMAVLATTSEAVYLRLPRELQRESGGHCSCGHCDGAGLWDTLVVPTAPFTHGASYSAWHSGTCHMPDSAVPTFVEHMRKRETKRASR